MVVLHGDSSDSSEASDHSPRSPRSPRGRKSSLEPASHARSRRRDICTNGGWTLGATGTLVAVLMFSVAVHVGVIPSPAVFWAGAVGAVQETTLVAKGWSQGSNFRSSSLRFGSYANRSNPSNPSLERHGGLCSASDHATWDNRSRRFSPTMSQCARPCTGISSCTADCWVKHGFSEPCSQCFGELASCSVPHCWMQCMFDDNSPGCHECVDSHCKQPYFWNCSGLDMPLQNAPKETAG
eukprot:gb/GFBE01080564.1/.p1 GENE.gb/GFBE01080564.1/~~gb/GFBE01080564.1/.p1  ORF type:complete len:239 (+),score=19.52 gb/GFBE01080564.1/:1-717(+)